MYKCTTAQKVRESPSLPRPGEITNPTGRDFVSVRVVIDCVNGKVMWLHGEGRGSEVLDVIFAHNFLPLWAVQCPLKFKRRW